MIDLEHFPTSEAARRMMKTVSHVYDKAYVAKWLFHVMGIEWDETWQYFNELRQQAFPETATWGIVYWEQRYHIPTDETLTLEERRQRVIVKRGKRSPMNPARLEQFSEDITGRQAEVTERNSEYAFTIAIMEGDSAVDYQALIDLIKSAKPSHLAFNVIFEVEVLLSIKPENEPWRFPYPLTGMEPDINMGGGITGAAILPAVSMTGSLFNYNICGDADNDL